MTLLDRYLHAVRFFLPRHQQDDIVRELSENIGSEVDERANALGRDLSEPEIADILRRHGHPMVVAARFGPRHHLIGPAMFPFYAFALKAGLAVSFVVSVVLAIIHAALRGDIVASLMDGLLAYPGRALIVFAWTTIVFAVLDVAGSRATFKADWDPTRIPQWMVATPHQGRLHGVVDVVFGAVGLGWFLLVPTSPWLALGPLAAVLEFAPVWRIWYVPLVLITAATLAFDVRRLIRPASAVSSLRAKVWLNTLQVLAMLAMLAARQWVVLRPGAVATPGRDVHALVEWVNVAFGIGLATVAIITTIEIARQLYRLRVSSAGKAPASAA